MYLLTSLVFFMDFGILLCCPVWIFSSFFLLFFFFLELTVSLFFGLDMVIVLVKTLYALVRYATSISFDLLPLSNSAGTCWGICIGLWGYWSLGLCMTNPSPHIRLCRGSVYRTSWNSFLSYRKTHWRGKGIQIHRPYQGLCRKSSRFEEWPSAHNTGL